ncbi:hypothetical protein F5888DRAFT_412077 [Russula emetica]|nr:hypothetical protein F5888DRAFT_412077 [Russula emetica]
MVNFHDPIVIAREYGEVYRFWGLMDGIFIWEFMITLDYEWSVIRGRRPYRWTIWIYSLIRVATLATVALNIFSLDATTRINCQVAANLQFIFAYLALATSSLLIVLRIIAIWDRKKVIVAFATGVWGINVAFLIQGVLRFRSSWEVDNRHGSLMGLGRLLWNQGVVWFLLAVVTELTPTLLIFLNLSQPLDLVFQVPWVITMSVAATRMYRSLSDFLSSDISQKILPTSGRNTLELNGTSTTPVLLTGIQVAVHTTHEQRFTPQANHFGSNIGGQPHGKPHELIVDTVNDHDIEGRAEK